jgi:hypothetical protein
MGASVEKVISEWVSAIRTMRAPESVDIITSGELERDFKHDVMGKKWILLKSVVRDVRL